MQAAAQPCWRRYSPRAEQGHIPAGRCPLGCLWASPRQNCACLLPTAQSVAGTPWGQSLGSNLERLLETPSRTQRGLLPPRALFPKPSQSPVGKQVSPHCPHMVNLGQPPCWRDPKGWQGTNTHLFSSSCWQLITREGNYAACSGWWQSA